MYKPIETMRFRFTPGLRKLRNKSVKERICRRVRQTDISNVFVKRVPNRIIPYAEYGTIYGFMLLRFHIRV
jgi:hypothetical protein